MRLPFRPTDLDAEFVFDRTLLGEASLRPLETILAKHAIGWSMDLHLAPRAHDQPVIDLARPGMLEEAVIGRALERGQTYRSLVRRYGRPKHERRSGSAELRGAARTLVVLVSVDAMIASPLGHAVTLGNSVALQVRGRSIEGRPAVDWVRAVFRDVCHEMAPTWASAHAVAEYWAKVMTMTPSIQAIGRDFGRYLPGLFWLNFFGARYAELIGFERLMGSPAGRTEKVDHGVLLELSPDPFRWDTAEYDTDESSALAHIGPDYFFAKAARDRPGIAPDWAIDPPGR